MIYSIGTTRYTGFLRKSMPKTALADVWTKDKSGLSEKEIVEKMVDLAHRDAAAGKDSLHDDPFVGSEWNKLHQGFICLSSPDRLGIIQKKLAQLTGSRTDLRLKSNSRSEAFAILFANSRGRRHDRDVSSDSITFRDEQGREVAAYSKYSGWLTFSTRAEHTRSYAFRDLWNQALADAKEELEQEELEKERLEKERLAEEAEKDYFFEAWA